MHIDDLHVEIMGIIFHIHIYQHFGSSHSLLLTSRRWYTIATSYGALWTTISWGVNCERSPISVKCRTLDELARAVRWTGQATFDLDIGGARHCPNGEEITRFISSVDEKWLSRCRSLTISMLNEHSDIPMDILNQLLCHSTFDALERLTWNCRGYGSRKTEMSMLIGWFELSSSRPRALKLIFGFSEYHTQEFPSQWGLLRRISSLALAYFNQPVPWNELEGLEHLNFARVRRDGPQPFRNSDIPYPTNLSDLVAPRSTSLGLEGELTRSDFPSKGLFRQLNRLVLRWFTTAQDENIFPEKFPSLLYLGIAAYRYNANFDFIVASSIDELEISITGDGFAPTKLATSLAQRVLRVDGESQLLEHLAQPLPIWDHLEEMRLTFKGNDLVPPVLIDALSRPTRVESAKYSTSYAYCFPQLKVFTIRHPTIWFHAVREDPPSEEEMEERAKVLRLVVEDRKRFGLSRLERIQVGWYWQYASDEILGDPLTDWRITSWTDCSEGEVLYAR